MTTASTSSSVRQALILDFDGVIVETEKLHFDCWNAAFQERFGIYLPGSFEQIVGLSIQEIYTLWSHASTDGSLHLTAEAEKELLARKTELYYEIGTETLTPIPGIVPVIKWARQHDWYVTIASRARRTRLLRTLDVLKLPVYFDLIMGTEDVVDPISDQKVHIRTVRPFDIHPANSVVIEDSASGVRSAKACATGMVIGLDDFNQREGAERGRCRPRSR